MKFAALVSGGKDSIYSVMECVRMGHELVACVHLGRPSDEQEESYMYQTAASETLTVLVEQCLGVPLVSYRRKGRSVHTGLVYEEGTSECCQDDDDDDNDVTDEVEDLYCALQLTKRLYPSIEAVSSGAILSTYQRVRIESVCARLDLTSLSPLWRRTNQRQLLHEMVHTAKIDAVLVKVAAPPGLCCKHLNRSVRDLERHFHHLYDKYKFHVCGEGGEYETLVLDCPLYKKKLVLDEVEIVVDDNDDGVGELRVLSCHAERKGSNNDDCDDDVHAPAMPAAAFVESTSGTNDDERPIAAGNGGTTVAVEPQSKSGPSLRRKFAYLPRVRRVPGGLIHVGEIVCPYVVKRPATAVTSPSETSEADLALQEATEIFCTLSKVLKRHGCSPTDVMMVHLYLSEMSHFATINRRYRDYFGVMLPPSRSCVGVGVRRLPGGRRILLDCLVQCGSGTYMRRRGAGAGARRRNGASDNDLDPYAEAALANLTSTLREVLHVQSISHWAPVCVGPYSQVNTYRNCVHFFAGQIGLVPSTMKLRKTWTEQLEQAWRNVAQVLDALNGGSLEHMLFGLVYVSTSCFDEESITQIEAICREQRQSNAGVVPGSVDGTTAEDPQFMGYEDEGTMIELMNETEQSTKKRSCPLLLVAIPEMPVGALVEVEIMAATLDAASCLEIEEYRRNKANFDDAMTPEEQLGWTTGHDFRRSSSFDVGRADMMLDCSVLSMASGAVVCAVVTAGVKSSAPDNLQIDVNSGAVLTRMLELLGQMTRDGKMAECCWLHYRLYYVRSGCVDDDGIAVRTAFNAAISTTGFCWGYEEPPVSTTIPVDGIRLLDGCSLSATGSTSTDVAFAVQALAIDPVRAETELWVHKGREE